MWTVFKLRPRLTKIAAPRFHGTVLQGLYVALIWSPVIEYVNPLKCSGIRWLHL